MELDDLADHGKPQSQAGAGLAGRVCLVEPLPDPGQVFLTDSDAVIFHIQTDGFLFPAQRYADKSALPAVFAGIFQKILDHTGKKGGIDLRMNSRFDLCLHPDIPKICILFFTEYGKKLGKIRILCIQLSCAKIQACHIQKLIDQQGHSFCLAADHADSLTVIFRIFPVFFHIGTLGKDDGSGGAQFMGGIGGKLFFCFEGLLQPLKHLVKGTGQPSHFIPSRLKAQSPAQVPPLGYAFCGPGDLVDGPQGMSGNEITACSGEKDDKGHDQEEHGQNPAKHLADACTLGGTADPDAVFPAGRDPQIENVKAFSIFIYFPGHAVF